MASKHQTATDQTWERIVVDTAVYPRDAFDFVQQGLCYTVERVFGDGENSRDEAPRHVSGQQLCMGLREFALMRWGYLARSVLDFWNITSTLDFGRIVFALIEAGQLQKTANDSFDDFRSVYDFRAAFEQQYEVPTAFV